MTQDDPGYRISYLPLQGGSQSSSTHTSKSWPHDQRGLHQFEARGGDQLVQLLLVPPVIDFSIFGPTNQRFKPQMIRKPSRVSQGAMISMAWVSFAMIAASPPVPITFISAPSSARKRVTIPSTSPT